MKTGEKLVDKTPAALLYPHSILVFLISSTFVSFFKPTTGGKTNGRIQETSYQESQCSESADEQVGYHG
jgi:hypothetical protein